MEQNDVYVIWDYNDKSDPQIVGMFDQWRYADKEREELKKRSKSGTLDLRIERWPEGAPRKKEK